MLPLEHPSRLVFSPPSLSPGIILGLGLPRRRAREREEEGVGVEERGGGDAAAPQDHPSKAAENRISE